MRIPPDWDKPKKDNDELCSKFTFETLAAKAGTINYRVFSPEKAEDRIPLVLYLHGADAIGNDNELPLSIHDVGTVFARDSWQEHDPCYIIAPQYQHGQYWSTDSMKELVHEVLLSFQKTHSVDPSRIYVYGYSAGGVGTFALIKEFPNLFAAAVSICGATRAADIEKLRLTPLWMIHANDDEIVKSSYAPGALKSLYHLGSRDIYNLLKDNDGQEFKYTEYPNGYMKKRYGVNPHCSWLIFSGSEGKELREWMFSKRRDSS